MEKMKPFMQIGWPSCKFMAHIIIIGETRVVGHVCAMAIIVLCFYQVILDLYIIGAGWSRGTARTFFFC